MEATLGPLLSLLEREQRARRPVALGVLVHTSGSTYRKPGALILIAPDGEYAGLISGGCLEADLRDHALKVIQSGSARTVTYDLQRPDEILWGLGLGCEGRMRIVLLRAGPENDYEPLACLRQAWEAHRRIAIGIVCDSARPDVPVGSLAPAGPAAGPDHPLAAPAVLTALAGSARDGEARWLHVAEGALALFVVPLELPPRLLILGAGPDALPVTDFASRLGWRVTVYDHRAAYARPAHFPASRVLLGRPEELGHELAGTPYSAAIVMSHHLQADLAYLRSLAATPIGYVGLLGPAQRRERLLGELGPEARALLPRLHAPVGLPLGGRSPEAIALAIVAEVQAYLQGRLGEAQSAPLRAASAE